MNKFLIKIIGIVIPIFLLIIAINYCIDPAHILHPDYEKKMVQILKSGECCTNISNFNERAFQREFIENLDSAPNIVILGSSRAMLINSEFLNERSVVNNCVSGASIEDYIAIYQLYKEKDKLPHKIIADIEFYMFNEYNGQTRWETLKKYYGHFFGKNESGIDRLENSTFFQLFSFTYFQESLKKVIQQHDPKYELKATTIKYNFTNTKLPDGTITYGKQYREANRNEIENKVSSLLNGTIYGLGNFKQISSKIFDEFEELINDAKNNNIEIEFFLSPLHPRVYKEIETNYPLVVQTENLIEKYAHENHIKVHGSFNPLSMNFDETFFYDGMHCKEKGIEKIIRN